MPWRKINGQIEDFESNALWQINQYLNNPNYKSQLENIVNDNYSTVIDGKVFPIYNFENGNEVAFQLAAATTGAQLMREIMFNNEDSNDDIKLQFREIMRSKGFGMFINFNSNKQKAYLHNVYVGAQIAFSLGKKAPFSHVGIYLIKKVNAGNILKSTTDRYLPSGLLNGIKSFTIGIHQANEMIRLGQLKTNEKKEVKNMKIRR